ncbi:MAG: hypothetical protein BGO39_15495 [Chloroflexi bacterium 54-19]|nr:MAG: hypothetical protein BGO39_15495 [Chloroflexi bacterium 54-19]
MDKTKLRKPKIGEVVCYVLDSGSDFGQIRPAKIMEVFETQNGTEKLRALQAPLLVNLKVYTENIEEEIEDFQGTDHLKFSRCLNLEKLPGTWHYPKTDNSNSLTKTQSSRSRIHITALGVVDEDYPDRVILWNRMVWCL